MRMVIILPFFLILILSNPQQTIGSDVCRCECCTSNNCNPTPIGTHSLWFCSEPTTCSKGDCVTWYPTICPPEGASGQTRAICVSNTGHHILPTLFIVIGVNLIIFLLKDKF